MTKLNKIFLVISIITAAGLLIGIALQQPQMYKPLALVTAISLAIGLAAVPSLKGYQYTAWIISAVVAGMLFPEAFKNWGGVNLRDKTLILVIIQLVMFGMGTHMSLKDFSGLASNVMVYLAKANLVLSVIVTAMATLAAPFLTPLLMKVFAGTLIKINFVDMMLEIIKIVLVPIGAALLHDFLKQATASQKKKVYLLAALSVVWIVIVFVLQKNITDPAALQSVNLSGFFAGAIIVGVLYNILHRQFPTLNKIMPLISMFGIIYFTTVTTAAGRDNLMKVGVLLFIASVIHNVAGYFFGYWLSRLFRMDKNSSRTIAFEVGLQNGGMASGIAGSMGKLGTVGLAAAVFSPWMNISGSILANYWRRKPVDDEEK